MIKTCIVIFGLLYIYIIYNKGKLNAYHQLINYFKKQNNYYIVKELSKAILILFFGEKGENNAKF